MTNHASDLGRFLLASSGPTPVSPRRPGRSCTMPTTSVLADKMHRLQRAVVDELLNASGAFAVSSVEDGAEGKS